MNKLTQAKIRKMVMQELASMVGEDALVAPKGKDLYRDTGYNPQSRSPHNLSLTKQSDAYDDFGGAQDACEQCGGMAYEGDCMECGYSGGKMLEEGDCGCSGESKDGGSDYSTTTMGLVDMSTTKNHHDHEAHHHNNYMAKPSLYKVAKYAQKLLHMIPDGYELDDWQRTKIAQISDDISEVYHSLDYDFHDDEY